MPPIYEFQCNDEKCNHRSEKLVKIGTEHIECSKCGSKAVKVWSKSSTHFKGGGWTPKFHNKRDIVR